MKKASKQELFSSIQYIALLGFALLIGFSIEMASRSSGGAGLANQINIIEAWRNVESLLFTILKVFAVFIFLRFCVAAIVIYQRSKDDMN